MCNVPLCRFSFPKLPSDETKLIIAASKDADERTLNKYKADYKKIVKFLIRHTNEECKWEKLKQLSFMEFLYEVGMFSPKTRYEDISNEDRVKAKTRYLDAIASGIRGSAVLLLERKVEDIFINGFNDDIMRLHLANIDVQLITDSHGAIQYMLGYMTKNEAGTSNLFKAIDEEMVFTHHMDKINAIASALDKKREVSIQECIYRLLGLPMTKCSVIVKYLSTVHPHFRDGLLKGDINELKEGESLFHNSPHDYYANRPDESNQEWVTYDENEVDECYWANLTLAEFWSKYDIIYQKNPSLTSNIIALKNGSYIRRRSKPAVLRYYLNYGNDEDLARGLLILFHPFRNELEEIHAHDVKQLLDENRDDIERKRHGFEKYKLMSELISNIQADEKENVL